MLLKVAKRERVLRYRPASPSLLLEAELQPSTSEPVTIANVLGIQSQFAPLAAIWSSCIEELRPLSRVLAKGIEVQSREAFDALPDELKARVEHPDKEKWDRLVGQHTDEDGCALVPVSKLATIHGLERANEAHAQAEPGAGADRGIRGLGHRTRCAADQVARIAGKTWFRCSAPRKGHASGRLPLPCCVLDAGAWVYVAAADGSVEDVEIDQVARFLESQFLLDPPDARRLEALKRVFMVRPPSLAGLGKRLQSALTREQREAVGRFLTGIAAANGIIDRKEVTALRAAYRALDIGVDQLNRLLEEFRRASQEPVEVERADPDSEAGEAIPARRERQPTALALRSTRALETPHGRDASRRPDAGRSHAGRVRGGR